MLWVGLKDTALCVAENVCCGYNDASVCSVDNVTHRFYGKCEETRTHGASGSSPVSSRDRSLIIVLPLLLLLRYVYDETEIY